MMIRKGFVTVKHNINNESTLGFEEFKFDFAEILKREHDILYQVMAEEDQELKRGILVVYDWISLFEEKVPKLLDVRDKFNQLITEFIDESSYYYMNTVLSEVYNLPEGAEVTIEFSKSTEKYGTKNLTKEFIDKIETYLKDEMNTFLQENCKVLKIENIIQEDDIEGLQNIKKILDERHLHYVNDFDNQ